MTKQKSIKGFLPSLDHLMTDRVTWGRSCDGMSGQVKIDSPVTLDPIFGSQCVRHPYHYYINSLH